jgi:hypothetical protein
MTEATRSAKNAAASAQDAPEGHLPNSQRAVRSEPDSRSAAGTAPNGRGAVAVGPGSLGAVVIEVARLAAVLSGSRVRS